MLMCGVTVLSSADDVTSLGVALMAGHAKGIELWDLTKEEDSPDYIGDTFLPAASTPGKAIVVFTYSRGKRTIWLSEEMNSN